MYDVVENHVAAMSPERKSKVQTPTQSSFLTRLALRTIERHNADEPGSENKPTSSARELRSVFHKNRYYPFGWLFPSP